MNNSSYCLKFSSKVADGIFITKTVLWLVGIFLSLIMIVIMMITKRLRWSMIYRLLTYLMATSILQGLCKILEQLPVEVTEDEQVTLKNGSGWHTSCVLFAYLDMVTTWMSSFMLIWIVLLMFWWYYHLVRGHSVLATNCVSHFCEVIGILLSILCSFVISCIPFIKNMYGISGPWCWIRTISEDDCLDTDLQKFNLGLTVITFCPQLGCLIFCSLCVVAIVGSYLRVPKSLHGQGRWRYRNSIKFIGLVLLYAIIYSLLSLLPWAKQLYILYYTNLKNHPPNYFLWIMHTVADPGRILILILALLMNPDIQKVICFCRSSVVSTTEHKLTDQATNPASTRIYPPSNSTFYNMPWESAMSSNIPKDYSFGVS